MTPEEIKTKKSVIFDNMDKYRSHRSWICGDFLPSVIRTKDFEVAIFEIPKGEKSDGHFHSKIIETNVIIRGSATIQVDGVKHKIKEGQIFTFPPMVKTNITYTSDTILLCIKTPSVPTDKSYG